MNNELALKTLKDFTDELENKYFIVYGTCLGAHREKNFIKHDLDVDVGIMRSDFNFEMLENLVKKGFKIWNMFGSKELGFEISFKKNGIKVDLMFFYYDNDKKLIWNSLWDNGGINGLSDMIIHSYDKELFEIVNIKLNNIKFQSLGLKYIKAVYGENWQTPITPWNWRTDHLCIDNNLKIDILKKYGR